MLINIKVKKVNENFKGFKILEQGDWIDLAVCGFMQKDVNRLEYWEGATVSIDFGFAMELPKGYEATILPRSSTFEKYGLVLTNSMGLIDNSYNGDNDVWRGKFFALKSGSLEIGDRIAQFRIQEKMEKPVFEYVEHLGNEDRGGYGQTGRK